MTELPKSKCRNVWGAYDTRKFISIWREKQPEIIQKKPKKELFQKWANELEEFGVMKTAEQVEKKLNNMKQRFKQTGCSPSNWEYWYDVREILGECNINEVEKNTIEMSEVSRKNVESQQDRSDALNANKEISSETKKSLKEYYHYQFNLSEEFKQRRENISQESKLEHREILRLFKELAEDAKNILVLVKEKITEEITENF